MTVPALFPAEEHLSFGDWLRRRRRQLDLTQAELADRVGCARVTIRKIEAEETRPSKQLAQALAQQLGIPPAEHAAFIRFARSGQTEVPPVSTAPAWNPPSRLSPLPVGLEALYGREPETQAMRQLLAEGARLVTLTGPGGVGKTSLAIQAAAGLGPRFEDGIAWVDLTPLRDAQLVPSTLTHALGLQERGGHLLEEMIQEFLQPRQVLLVLDNFEHVISAAPLVAGVLSSCPRVAAIVTSREPLRVQGEQQFPVRLLDQASALELFVARARRVKPDFARTDENAAALAGICARLDGLPLAIELVATHVSALTPQELWAGLDEPLSIRGRRDAPARHRTLDETIRWSYDLLDAREQELFRRLAVFAGGWTLQAAQAVCGDLQVLEPLTRLVEKSLVVAEPRGESTRYRLLGTIREFAQNLLRESGEADGVRNRHAEFFLQLAEEADPHLSRADQLTWLARLDLERDNGRAALAWSRTAEGSAEWGLRLAGALGLFWDIRSYFREGREHLSAALADPGAQERTAARARALFSAGRLASSQGEFLAARELFQASRSIYQELGPASVALADALRMLGYVAIELGDYTQAFALSEQAWTMMRELQDVGGMVRTARDLGWIKLRTGDYAAAAQYLQDALQQVGPVGDEYERLISLSGLAQVQLRQGDLAQATQLEEEVLQSSRDLDDRWRMAASLGNLGQIARRRKDIPQARRRLGASLEMRWEFGDRAGCAWCLEQFAEMALWQGEHAAPAQRPEELRRAARLWGAAAALRAAVGSVIDLVDRSEYDRQVASARAQLDAPPGGAAPGDFQAAWNAGQAMSLKQAVEYALASPVPPQEPESPRRSVF